jgi:hypothetical protein
MGTIEWPKKNPGTSYREAPSQVLLPELELIDADYEAAGEALRKLEGCIFEVVFVHEVAARHCRERQLAELLRGHTIAPSNPETTKDFIRRWEKSTPIGQFDPFREQGSKFNRSKKRSKVVTKP